MAADSKPEPAQAPHDPLGLGVFFGGVMSGMAQGAPAPPPTQTRSAYRSWFHSTRFYDDHSLAPYLERLRTITGKQDLRLSWATDPALPGEQQFLLTDGPLNLNTTYPNNQLACFKLAAFPGCCGLQIITALVVSNPWTRKGIGSLLLSLAQDIAKDNGYTVVVATDIADQPTDRMFKKDGWKYQFEFRNRRTTNRVNTWIKRLPEKVQTPPIISPVAGPNPI